MTLDETEKQTNEQENSDEPVQENKSKPTTSVSTNEDNSNQEDSMQWATSSNNNEELNKVANKRTFDQISENQQQQQQASTSEASSNISQNTVVEENNRDNSPNDGVSMKEEESNETTSKNENNSGEENGEQKQSSSNNDEEKEECEETMDSECIKEPVKFKVVYAKEIYELTRDQNETVQELKNHLQKLTSVVTSKLCYKGNLNDNKTLKECGIKDGVKVMMIGSKATDILAMTQCTKETIIKETIEPTHSKEPLCQQKQHKKIIEKGIPEQAMSAWIGEDCPLPLEPLTGMLNKYGNKVRMTFKLETDQLWISTKERTQKIPMTSIKSVISEPIENYQHYHIMALQIGPTEASRLWFYWVPTQYVRAIKNVILRN